MFILVPKRYDTPKWQSPVIPRSHAFVFQDGTAVRTIYELKHALTVLPDEVIYKHLHTNQNDIADWCEYCVGDIELASALRTQTHRWGLIVSLERQMMRTLNLPAYLAQRWLSPAEAPFIFVTGESCSSLSGLADILPHIPDDSIAFHYERFPNDLSAWITEAIGDYEIADLLMETTNKPQMVNYLKDHLEMLQDASECDKV
jgi:hypothetical protein